MVPNKFEEQIREQINSREIQPSEMAWDRLDAMLSVAEEKKTKRFSGWLYIAAGILVALTAGMYFFTQNASETTPNNPTVVTNETTKDSVEKSQDIINENQIINQKSQPLVQIIKESQPDNNNPKPTGKDRVSIIKSNQSVAQKSTPNQQKNSPIQNQEVIAENKVKTESKNPTPVVQNPINSDNREVIAQNDSKEKPLTKVTVSANSLLSQVDGELELTFREKVLQKVNKNYKEVKVALSTRNTKQ